MLRETETQFVPIAELAEKAAIPVSTLRRQLKDLGVALYESPRDRRVRLVRAEDAEALGKPRLVRAGSAQIAAA
jgi:hypothetical protein